MHQNLSMWEHHELPKLIIPLNKDKTLEEDLEACGMTLDELEDFITGSYNKTLFEKTPDGTSKLNMDHIQIIKLGASVEERGEADSASGSSESRQEQ